MELRHLRYFVAVVEEESLTTAAELRLHTSQPSLSRQIRDLEYQVGTQLLSRSVNGVEPTAAGKAFLDHARLALAQVDAAVEAARRAAQPARKTFAIGFQTGQEMNWLPQAIYVLRDEGLQPVQERHPPGIDRKAGGRPDPCCINRPGARVGARLRMRGGSSGLEYQRGRPLTRLKLSMCLSGVP
jgi:hypothetical protein